MAYTQNAWKGKKYDGKWHSAAEIAKMIRKDLKKAFPDCKFSVTKQDYAGGRTITISLMRAPFKVIEKASSNYIQLNHFYLDKYLSSANPTNPIWRQKVVLTPKAVETLKQVVKIAQAYNYSDCDAMIDYFDVNFYLNLEIGKWNKPFEEKEA